jgi:hypothetical protein
MSKFYWFSGLLNFIFGCLLFFVLSLWLMSFIYMAEISGWIVDPTLDEGLLPIFLFLSSGASLICLPLFVLFNTKLWNKVHLNRVKYAMFSGGILISGLLFTFGIIGLR